MAGRFHPGATRRAAGTQIALLVILVVGSFALACASPALTLRHRASEQSWRDSTLASTPVEGEAELFSHVPHLERKTLVTAVLRRNPSIAAARWAWKAALARYPQERSLDDPILGYGVTPTSFGSSSVRDAHKVDLSQHVPFPGKLALRGEIALAEAEAAEHDLGAVRLRLATVASLLFDDLWFLDRALALNAEHTELLDEFLRIATARYEVGEASQQDPLQAEVEQAHLLHRDVVLTTARRVAREQLNVLLHRRPDRPLPPPPDRLDPDPTEELDRSALVTEALQARPELRAAQARVAARESAVALERREFFPDFTLIGSYNRLWQAKDLQPFVGVRLNVPLRVARRRAALDEARARYAHATSEREDLEDQVRFGVESGVDRLEEARHVLRLFESRILPASRDQVAAARAGFETGRNSFLALIEAERNLRTSRLGYDEALATVSRRRAELERAVGRIPGLYEVRSP